VRKNWLTTLPAVICAVGMAATSADASPAGMTMTSRWSAKSKEPANMPPALRAEASVPSSEISPWRHPVKYLAAAVSELPIGSKSKRAGANAVMQPVPPKSDSISLDKPAGPPTPQLLMSLAQISEQQGDVAQARGHYQHALSMWPGHVDVLRAAARMEDRQGDLRLAEHLYQQAVAGNPQHAGALNDLGLCLARQGRLEPSVQMIEQAVHLQPDKALYRNNAATVLVEMRQDQRALAHLAAVHGVAEANFNLGQLFVQRGRAADAAPYFQAAIEQNPELQAAHVALAQLQGTDMTQGTAATEATPPAGAPVTAPQAAPGAGPQLGYPATARSPEIGASSYAPPTYQAPSRAMTPTDAQRVGSRPRYLPTVGNQPGPTQR
jgi:tetratricopeptide (TPR) repeat protein